MSTNSQEIVQQVRAEFEALITNMILGDAKQYVLPLQPGFESVRGENGER